MGKRGKIIMRISMNLLIRSSWRKKQEEEEQRTGQGVSKRTRRSRKAGGQGQETA